MHIFRFLHLNIYYEFGIFYNKFIEKLVSNISSDIYFLNIFTFKLCIYLYYGRAPSFYYGMSEYYKYPPYIVIIVSSLGIAFWVRISEILEPILGKNKYINLIADNTFSIMINHSFALDIIRTLFAFISQKTKYCKDFDFNRYYSMDHTYIYLPKNDNGSSSWLTVVFTVSAPSGETRCSSLSGGVVSSLRSEFVRESGAGGLLIIPFLIILLLLFGVKI